MKVPPSALRFYVKLPLEAVHCLGVVWIFAITTMLPVTLVFLASLSHPVAAGWENPMESGTKARLAHMAAAQRHVDDVCLCSDICF